MKSLRICVNDNYPDPSTILSETFVPALEFLSLDSVAEMHLIDISRHPRLQRPDHLPYLKHLSVSLFWGQCVQQDIWFSFCNIFPSITHFTMQSNASDIYSPTPFVAALCLRSATSPAPLILAQLHTLSFNQNNIPTALLCNLVANRSAAGRPLRCLQLPVDMLHDKALARSLDWLREHVEVEEYQATAFVR